MIRRLHEVLPPAYRHARMRQVPPALKRRLLAARRGIYLWGPVGTGKTHAMAAMARHIVCNCALDCRRVTFNDLLLEVRASWRRRGGPDEWEVINEFRDSPVLIIEDIATVEQEKAIAMRVLLEILDWRCEHELPTYFTSNRPPEHLSQIYDERICSRVLGSCEVMQLTGVDRRIALQSAFQAQ